MVESNYEETKEDWIVQSLVINWSRTSDVSYSEVYPSSLLDIALINPNYIDEHETWTSHRWHLQYWWVYL